MYYCFVLYYVCSAFFVSCQARLCFVCDCSERSVRGRYVNAHSHSVIFGRHPDWAAGQCASRELESADSGRRAKFSVES